MQSEWVKKLFLLLLQYFFHSLQVFAKAGASSFGSLVFGIGFSVGKGFGYADVLLFFERLHVRGQVPIGNAHQFF